MAGAHYPDAPTVGFVMMPCTIARPNPGPPYVYLHLPTGGGKTLVASHAVGVATRDLLQADPACPIRYILTMQQLREGWDCPFAYVLCSVAEITSSTAVDQILGRIMRLPQVRRKQHAELNKAYAFAVSSNFVAAVNALADALVQNGFERHEVKDYIEAAPRLPQFAGPLFYALAADAVNTVQLRSMSAS